jgi:hypothetical protein
VEGDGMDGNIDFFWIEIGYSILWKDLIFSLVN